MVSRFFFKNNKPNQALQAIADSPSPQKRRLSGFLSPSGQLTIGYLPPEKKRRADSIYELHCSRVVSVLKTEYVGVSKVSQKLISVQTSGGETPLGLSSVQNYHSDLSGVFSRGSRCEILKGLKDWNARERSLDSLEKAYNSCDVKGKNGLKGITKNGQKRVKEGCYLLQKRYGRRLGFYTLTCPYTVPELIYTFNQEIAEISRRFFQDCKRFYEEAGVKWSQVFVYEYQDSRYEQSGIPVLHIHYIAPCYYPGTTEFVLGASEIRYLWMRSVAMVCGYEADTSASVDAQVIQKSASGYLAKYLSKGGDTISYLGEIAPSQIPSQWWGMTKNVREAINRCTTPIPIEICEYLMSGGGQNEGEILYTPYRRYIDVCIGFDPVSGENISFRVGMSARLNANGVKAMQTWDKSALMDL
jgi:hypothetical protein